MNPASLLRLAVGRIPYAVASGTDLFVAAGRHQSAVARLGTQRLWRDAGGKFLRPDELWQVSYVMALRTLGDQTIPAFTEKAICHLQPLCYICWGAHMYRND